MIKIGLVICALLFPVSAWAQASTLSYGQYFPTLVTPLTPDQKIPLQLDNTGALRVTGSGGGGTITVNTQATASATFPSLSAGLQSLYENLMGQLYVDHPTLDVTGPGTSAGALRVVCADNCGASITVPPPMDVLAGPTAISSGGTPSLSVVTNGTSTTNIVLTGASGLTATFTCSINGSFQPAYAFNRSTGFTESGASGNGVWTLPSAGCAQIVITASAGSATAYMEASAGPPVPPVNNFVYLSSPSTLSNGQVAPFTSTNDMRLRVSLDVAAGTNKGGSITAGGTSQTLAAANANRRRIWVENPCSATTQGIPTAEPLFINFTSAASLTNGQSIELAPCGSYDSSSGPAPTELISVIATTTAHQYAAREQ